MRTLLRPRASQRTRTLMALFATSVLMLSHGSSDTPGLSASLPPVYSTQENAKKNGPNDDAMGDFLQRRHRRRLIF